jgi:hypothetical protein
LFADRRQHGGERLDSGLVYGLPHEGT